MTVRITLPGELASQTVAESGRGTESIAMTEIFTAGFMGTYSNFESIGAFFEHSPWSVRSHREFKRIPANELDSYVCEQTGFSDWETMLAAAAREWAFRRAG